MNYLTRTVRPLLFNKIWSTTIRSVSNTKTYDTNTSLPKFSSVIIQNHWIWQEGSLKGIVNQRPSIQNPMPFPGSMVWVPPADLQNEITEAPSNTNNVEKEAARLIVIRKRKMKKHKLQKLRKRMKFEWAKVRQRRELRKEKAFQAGLISAIKTAERFSAEDYVTEKIRQATETPLPRFWKGRRLPEFIIRQKLGLDKVDKN